MRAVLSADRCHAERGCLATWPGWIPMRRRLASQRGHVFDGYPYQVPHCGKDTELCIGIRR